jgi:hypothetical protein
MANPAPYLVDLKARDRLLAELRASVDTGGGPPHDGDMETRVKKLEDLAEKTVERLAALEQDVAVIKSNYATKADIAALGAAMHSDINSQTWKLITWVSAFGTGLVCITYFIATHAK